MSTPSMSLIARPYSARLRRWNGRDPGLGLTSAARSIRDSSATASALICSGSGRRALAGGIMPARSLRIIFSVVMTWSGFAAFDASNDGERELAGLGAIVVAAGAGTCFTIAVCSAAPNAGGGMRRSWRQRCLRCRCLLPGGRRPALSAAGAPVWRAGERELRPEPQP